MNRQVVGFLSLFSLVLVLSVYYVTSPTDSKPTKDVNNNLKESIDVSSEDYYFSSYSLIRDENHRQVIEDQVAIISSSESTSEEVVSAREKVSQEEKVMEIELALESAINQIPFNASYVEITDNEFIMKAYRVNAKEDEETNLVLSIFETADKYLLTNNISFINSELAQVEIVY